MSTHIDKLRSDFEKAEAKAQKIMADKDEALQKVRDQYGDKLRAANDDAATAQQEWLSAQVAESLKDRPDGETVAAALGIELS